VKLMSVYVIACCGRNIDVLQKTADELSAKTGGKVCTQSVTDSMCHEYLRMSDVAGKCVLNRT